MTVAPATLVLLIGLVVASATDLRRGRIPNALTGSLMATGLVLGMVSGGVLDSMAGLGLAFAIHFPMWVLGVEKGGDAKLLMGAGALMGWSFALEITAWCAILYLPAGLVQLAVQGKLGNLWRLLLWMSLKARGLDPGDPPPPTMLRTAPIIAAAGLSALATPWFEFTW